MRHACANIAAKTKEIIHTLKSDLVLNADVPPPSLSALSDGHIAIIDADAAEYMIYQGLNCWLMLVQPNIAIYNVL